jgi:hypothetical protein
MESENLISMVMRHEQTLFAQAQQSTACMANHDVERAFAVGCCALAIYQEVTNFPSRKSF